MMNGNKKSTMLPKSWKKSFDNGSITRSEMKYCNECSNDKICDECNFFLVNENKHFGVNLILLQRKPSNRFGHMLPYYQEKHYLFNMSS